MIRGKEITLSIVAFSVGIAIAVGAYFTEGYWESLLLDAAMVFVALGIGLIVINFYLDMKARREAVDPLLGLVQTSIQQHHNDLIDRAWEKLGKSRFSELVDRYMKHGNDPLALNAEERDAIYVMVKSDKDRILELHNQLQDELKELAAILGWSFDPLILRHIFECRYAITRLRAIEFDDTNETKAEVCRLYLDIDINAFGLNSHLTGLIGLKKEDMYYE